MSIYTIANGRIQTIKLVLPGGLPQPHLPHAGKLGGGKGFDDLPESLFTYR